MLTQTSEQSSWSLVELGLVGVPAHVAEQGLPELQQKLSELNYVRNPRTWWDASLSRILVNLEVSIAEEAESFASEVVFDNFYEAFDPYLAEIVQFSKDGVIVEVLK
jgi:hypothetical protein